MAICKTQEIAILLKNLRNKKYEKVFDFHEANAKGFFLYCYGNKNKSLSKNIIGELARNSVVLDSGYKDQILESKNGILYVPWYARIYLKMKKIQTVALYYYNKGVKNVFTFETSKNITLDERKRTIKIILGMILE